MNTPALCRRSLALCISGMAGVTFAVAHPAAASLVVDLKRLPATGASISRITPIQTGLTAQPNSLVSNDFYSNTDSIPSGTNTARLTPAATNPGTYSTILSDDIQTTNSGPKVLNQLAFTIVNSATTSVPGPSAYYLVFYSPNATNTGPGNYIGLVNFNLSTQTLAGSTGYTFTSNPIAGGPLLPTSFWVGTFVNNVTSAYGVFLSDPPTVGSSNNNLAYRSTATALTVYNTNNQVGTPVTSAQLGAPANVAFEFAPEPSSMLLGAVGLFGLARRRRAAH